LGKIEGKYILAEWKKFEKNGKLLPLFHWHKKGSDLNLPGYHKVT
jgi:hypothetical protein